MPEAIRDGSVHVLAKLRAVHRRQPAMRRPKPGEIVRLQAGLRIDQLQFIRVIGRERGAGLRADRHPTSDESGSTVPLVSIAVRKLRAFRARISAVST